MVALVYFPFFGFHVILILYEIDLFKYLIDGSSFELGSQFLLFGPEGNFALAFGKQFCLDVVGDHLHSEAFVEQVVEIS